MNLDPHGYVITDKSRQTSCQGIYAAGDVCQKNLRQVVTAVGDGATAATELEKYTAAMQGRTGIYAKQVVKKGAAPDVKSSGGFFSQDIINQLNTVFSKMERKIAA